MASETLRDILLNTARHDFPVFYRRATARETKLMDMMVLLTALFVRLQEPHNEKNGELRTRLEETGATENIFSELRKEVRDGHVFGTLPNLERQKIQRVIFNRVPEKKVG
ncbi:MAG: hypothetical protein ABIZ49_07955 [Opitutaceae bacterium]